MNMYVHAKRFALVWYAIPRLCKCSHSIVKARSFSSLRLASYSVAVEKEPGYNCYWRAGVISVKWVVSSKHIIKFFRKTNKQTEKNT